jgi:hypothetical protein
MYIYVLIYIQTFYISINAYLNMYIYIHRFKKDQKHKFVVSFLIKTSSIGEDNTYKCVGTFDSKSFNMQCKRRAKTYSPIIGGTELNKSTVYKIFKIVL